MKPRRAKPSARPRALVSSIAAAPAKRFGRLLTRALPGAAVIGDASILYESLPARTRLPEISHLKTGEWILVLKGSMTAYLSGRPIRARSGSIIAIPPGVPHRFVTGRSACQAVSIFSPALAIGPSADIVAAP